MKYSATIEWIKASERKPPLGLVVLVEGGCARWMRTADGAGEWRTVTGFEFPGAVINWDVTFWAELPEPPRET